MKFNGWSERSNNAIHGGALTNSKRPESFVKGVYPTHLVRAHGCHTWDAQGKKYTDYICSLGANLVGHGNQNILDSVCTQMGLGSIYSLGSVKEVEAAEMLKEIFFFMGKVRFLKTGSEASTASLRIARAHTNRKIILSDGYHAWHDEFVSLTPPATGCVDHNNIIQLKSLDQITTDVAAVIVEPIVTEFTPERIEYLKDLRKKCSDVGALLIFDEIITGFRFKSWSVSHYTGIRPDILLLGKAMGGGLPLSAIMTANFVGESTDWFVSSTFAGDIVALSAFRTLITLLRTTHKIDTLWADGERFQKEFNSISDLIQIQGYPTRGVFVGTDLNKALFFQEAVKAGILFGPSFFYNFAHEDQRESVISACRDILLKLKLGQIKLEGEMPKKAFAQSLRESKQ